jgi:hypothetical protein
MTEAATSARRIAVKERRALALDLRKQGGTYRKIADILRKQPGVSPKYDFSQAYEDVKAELDRLNAENAESAEELRRLQAEQLTELYSKYYAAAAKGDIGALDRILSIMDRLAKLYGLYTNTVNVAGEVKQSGTLTHAGSVDVQHIVPQVRIFIPDNGRGDSTISD